MGFQGGGHGVDGGDGRGCASRDGEELGAVEAGGAVDVCRGVDGWTVEGFAEADVQRDGVLLAYCCEDGGGIVSCVSEHKVLAHLITDACPLRSLITKRDISEARRGDIGLTDSNEALPKTVETPRR